MSAEEEKKAEPNEHINLKVVDATGNELVFKIKKTTPLQKLMTAYCDRQGKNVGDVRFLFDGVRINGQQTPEELEMEDNDVINSMIQQVGGHREA